MAEPADGSVGSAVRYSPHQAVELLNGRVLVFPASGLKLPVGEEEYRLISALSRFLPAEKHANALMESHSGLRAVGREGLVAVLSELRDAGALISTDDIIAATETAHSGRSEVRWVAIPSAKPGPELAQALESSRNNARSNGRSYGFAVAAQTELRTYADAVADQAGVPADALDAAIFGFRDGAIAPGANRNVILLQTTGSMFMTMDDDTVCETAWTERNRTLIVRGHEDPQRIRQSIDRESALSSLRFESRDWVADHERLLGRSPSAIVADFAREQMPDFDTMCPHLFEALMTGRGRVVITLNGAAGDSGMHACSPFLTHPEDRAYDPRVRTSREIVRSVSEYSISHGIGLAQTMFAGLDNRDILPPFFPSYRNEDGIFAFTVSQCVKDAFFGHVPLVMQHLPTGTRAYAPANVGKLRVSDFVMAACSLWNPGPAMETRRRLKALGWHLEALGEMPEREFLTTLTPPLFGRLSGLLTRGRQALAAHNRQPEWWAREGDEYLERLVNAALEPDYLTASDIDASAVAKPMDHLRDMIRRYGFILQWWPEIVDAAKELGARGVRPVAEERG